jgi:hypothetical protein
MIKKLTTRAATSLLLLGASGVAMAQQELPPFHHWWLPAFKQRQNSRSTLSQWEVRAWMVFKPCVGSP